MTPADLDALKADLIRDEDQRRFPYRCPAGYLTIGVGRNLDTKGLSKDESLYLLDNDITECLTDLRTFDWFTSLDAPRQRALLNMRFQLGPAGFRGFTKMLHALAGRDLRRAVAEARDSKWARTDSPERAARVLALLEHGR